MIYVSSSAQELNFSIAGKPYKVPPGGEVNIPERYAYALKGMPLLLKPGQPVEQPPDEETMEVWRTRAHQIKARAEADAAGLHKQVEEMADALAAEREAREGFVAQLRDALGIKPGDSIIGAIESLKELATAPKQPPKQDKPR